MKLTKIKPGAWDKLKKQIMRHAKNEPAKSDKWEASHADTIVSD